MLYTEVPSHEQSGVLSATLIKTSFRQKMPACLSVTESLLNSVRGNLCNSITAILRP